MGGRPGAPSQVAATRSQSGFSPQIRIQGAPSMPSQKSGSSAGPGAGSQSSASPTNPFDKPITSPSYPPIDFGEYSSKAVGMDPNQSLDFTTKLREQREALEAQLQQQRDLVNQYRGDYEQQQQRMGDLEISYPPDPRIQDARNFLAQQRQFNGRTPNPYYGMTPQQYIKDMEDAMRNQPGAP